MRKCKGFLQTYLEYTETQESPELFHLWGGVSIIAATLDRKCYIEQGFYRCYPNQYIIFVSESARCRKTTAADVAINIYRKAAVRPVITEKITSASLSRYLSEACIKTGYSHAYIYSPELGAFLGSDSYESGLMTLITTLYGCPGEWESRTKTQGIDILKDVFINILGCTVPSWLAKMPSDMVEGGFSSRAIFVVQNIPRPPNPRPKMTAKMKILTDNMVADIIEMNKLSGEFKLTNEAEVVFDVWYNTAYKLIDKRDPRVKAYYARKGDHVLKLSMIVSASEGDSMVVDALHIQKALGLLHQVEDLMPTAFRGVSFSDSTKFMDKVLMHIEEAGGKIDFATLLRTNRFYLDKKQLTDVIETLRESNLIREVFKDNKRWIHIID